MRAVVDLGSNSVKFAVGDCEPGGLLQIRDKDSWITRLGKNLKASGGRLDAESIAKTEAALKEMAERLKKNTLESLHVVATSAVRDSKNPEEIASRVKRILGVELRILSGREEARLSIEGAAAAARRVHPNAHFVFFDVGGASTECGVIEPRFEAHSFQAGAVRCHEALGLDHAPVSDAVWARARKDIEGFLPQDEWGRVESAVAADAHAVAVGGSLVLAARVAGAKAALDVGFVTSCADFEALNERLRRMSFDERMKLPNMVKGREDIVVAGLLCLTTLLRRLKKSEVLVTEWGLRHGILSRPELLD